MEYNILIVDDEPKNLQVLGNLLKQSGYHIEFSTSGEKALSWINRKQFDIILLDIMMPEMDGYEVCKRVKSIETYKDVPIIFLTAKTETSDKLFAFKIGAQDYVTKPFDKEELLARVDTHLKLYKMHTKMEELVYQRTRKLQEAKDDLKITLKQLELLKDKLHEENTYMQEEIKLTHNFEHIIGQSNLVKKMLKGIEDVAQTEATVLILGETGTGKELVARAIHNISKRKDKPLVKINCASLPDHLIESELFGHEKGAFTDAHSARKGKFELAHGGTIFLDEIGELPLTLQPKLLRVLQEGEFERLGSEKSIKVNVRVIAATNRDLNKMVDQGNYRSDLYYRLNIYPINCPSLRERKEDIKLLVDHFIQKYTKEIGKDIEGIAEDSLKKLENYNWPGNIRELENIIQRNIITSKSKKLTIESDFEPMNNTVSSEAIEPLDIFLKKYILRVLEETNWRISGNNGAAALLGLHPNTLRSRMEKLGIKKTTSYE